MQIHPQFLFWIIFNTRIFLIMQSVKSTTHYIVQILLVSWVNFNPLALLYQFEYICSCSYSIWESTSCISSQTKKSYNCWSVRLKLRVFSWLLVLLSSSSFDHRTNNGGGSIFIVVDPRSSRILISQIFLSFIDLNPFWRGLFESDLVLMNF